MKLKITAILIIFAMALTLAACGSGEETTLTGMVVSVDGTVISLMEMDMSSMGGSNIPGGERPEMPGGMEGMPGFGNFNPEDFAGNFPQWGSGELPEDFTIPGGGSIPDFGGMPNFGGGSGGMVPGFGSFDSDAETQSVDIGKAHISVEIDGGKASGNMSDIKAGTFVTITLNKKGVATYVLISSSSFYGQK